MRLRHLLACLLAAAPITSATGAPATAAPPRPDASTATATTTIAVTISLRSPHEQQLRGLISPQRRARDPATTTLTDIQHVDAAVWTPQRSAAPAEPDGYPVRADAAEPHSGPGRDPVTGLGAPGRTFVADVG